MPELPEVETIRRQLAERITGARITRADILLPKLVQGTTISFFKRCVTGRTVNGVHRRGKYLVIELANNYDWITHLRMTGKYVVASSGSAPEGKHVRARFSLANGKDLYFIDPRTFGVMSLAVHQDLPVFFKDLGIEPLDRTFTGARLRSLFSGRTIPVKTALLDQKLVAGIGNIYASEALFNARVSPLVPANRLTVRQAQRLVAEIKKILRRAIRYNGTTIIDFKGVDEKTGRFRDMLNVYGRAGEPCPVCGKTVKRIVQAQRSTFYCPDCQNK